MKENHYSWDFYPEIVISTNGEDLRIQAPWVLLELEAAPETLQAIKEVGAKAALQPLLGSLSQYPIAYMHPRNLSTTTKSEKIKTSTEGDLWSSKLVLEKCICPDGVTYDPLSLLSYCRRIWNKLESKMMAELNLPVLLAEKKAKSHPEFLAITSNIIHANYYITARCNECISPAISKFPIISKEITSFLNEENGHDLIMKRGLQGLENTKPELPKETVELMDLLKSSAETHWMDLSLIVALMENAHYAEINGITDLLETDPSTKSAAGSLLRHHQINSAGQHDLEAWSWCENIGGLNQSEIISAICTIKKAVDLRLKGFSKLTLVRS